MKNNIDKDTKLKNARHSCAHLLAAAVTQLYPKTLPAIGPNIKNGFYYDFDMGKEKITNEDFEKIESKMKQILKTWDSFEKIQMPLLEAKKHYKDNPYKLELIDELVKKKHDITFYESGKFLDLCKGGHTKSPKEDLKNFKLLSVAGAYWRGSEKNKMLTRIYGTLFLTKEGLEDYLDNIKSAKEHDHRKIGRDLDLFTFSDLVGSGLPLFTPKGALVRKLITDYVEEVQTKKGYQQVWTPQISKGELFKVSGHYDKYKDSMFKVVSSYTKEEFFLKPMNCPQHTQIYASRGRSYKELPIRMTDFAMLYRDEKPGELSGLARVRAFSQDDCHVFCREDQVDDEVDLALSMTKEIMTTFGFKYKYRLSTHDPKHPEKYIGDPKTWERVEIWAERIMERNKIEHFEGVGEAAFYAPKMDLIATDALGREWQLSTIQIDYFLPERFDLTYTDRDGSHKRPVMLHRAIVGSPERFMAIILEHFAGNLPVWLSPVQVKILPISTRHNKYSQAIAKKLKSENIRLELDDRNETLGAKIRDAQLQKVSYMFIVGDKEEKTKSVSIRTSRGQDLGSMDLIKFTSKLNKEIKNKTIA